MCIDPRNELTAKLPTCCEHHGFGAQGCQQRHLCPVSATKQDDLEGYGQAPVDRVLPTMWLPIKARLWLMSVDWFGVVRALVMGVCIGSICAAFWPLLGQVVGGVVIIGLP